MLKPKLKDDSVLALKNRDQSRVDVLRFLISVIDKKEMQLPPGEMKEADEVAVLRKELKNKEESREMFVKGNRDDLVKQLDYEIEVLKEYLPKEMDEAEITKIVDEVIGGLPNANFGMIMGQVMKKVAGKVGGEVVTRIVKEKMTNS